MNSSVREKGHCFRVFSGEAAGIASHLRVQKRKGSMAVEAAISFTAAILIMVGILGTLVSVVASDAADWEAMHSLESAAAIYNVMPHSPVASFASVAAAVNVSYPDALHRTGMCKISLPVSVAPDDYGNLKLKFSYDFKLRGALEGDSIVLPVGGFQVTDGIDFSERMVFITRTGEKYHEDGCFHLRKSKFGIDVEEAKKKGYTPCKNCH